MTILDDLAALARERHFGHESELVSERALCRISRIPHEWCLGCRRGFHRRQALEQFLAEGVDEAREPDYCPRCTQQVGYCRCDPAASE